MYTLFCSLFFQDSHVFQKLTRPHVFFPNLLLSKPHDFLGSVNSPPNELYAGNLGLKMCRPLKKYTVWISMDFLRWGFPNVP